MAGRPLRFGVFEFAPDSGELTRDGRVVRLQAQPARLLAALLARPGELVSREQLQRELWGAGTHVDFDRGLNFCVSQVRSALGDTADAPRYIATVPKQGYRFIAPVQPVTAEAEADDAHAPLAGIPPRRQPSQPGRRWLLVAAGALVVIGALAAVAWPRLTTGRPTVVVVPFYNETGRADLDAVARAVGDATVARLASDERLPHLSVIGNADALRNPFARSDVQRIASSLGAEWVVIGQLKADGQQLRVIGHLIRAGDMTHVWAQTFDEPLLPLAAQARVAESIAAAVSHAVATR